MSRLTRRLRAPKLESLFIAVVVLYGFRLGAIPIGDNSMLTHLRTGIDMAHGGGIPRVDPYSWTAAGDPWVVQSWLPEWTYGWAHRLGGFHLVVLEQAILLGLLAWLMARLARAGSPLRTLVASVVVVGIGSPFWMPRPLIFGLVCMALVVAVVERRMTPWWVVPIVWIWVQSDGSFLLGLAWLTARMIGEWLDWRSSPRESLRYLGAFLGGLAASVLNPLGARLLVFPLTLGGKREVLEQIGEWRSADFQDTAGRIALLFGVVALVLLFRSRLSWRDVIPAVAFLAMGLVASRNMPFAAIVLAPTLGRALRREPAPTRPPATLADTTRLRFNRAFAVAIGFAFVALTVAIFDNRALTLRRYPQNAAAYLARQGLLAAPHRVANQDFVGNYLIFRFGRHARVFIDDRYSMYPVSVSEASFRIAGGGDAALQTIDRRKVDVVIWDRTRPLPPLLEETHRWRRGYADEKWIVLQRV